MIKIFDMQTCSSLIKELVGKENATFIFQENGTILLAKARCWRSCIYRL